MNETPKKRKHQSPTNPGFSLGIMRKCPVCGREFLIPDMSSWAYKQCYTKINGTTTSFFFCKWSCMRSWEKEHKPPRKKDEVYDY